MDFIIERLDARPGPARLPLRAVRADRPQAADGPLRHARGGGRRPAPREGVLVDLLRVVRQSLRASVESYSIKKMEAFYGFVREIDLRDAGSSIVAFEEWLELGEGERPAADHLERIERYNRDDVVSNLRLRDWLEAAPGRARRGDRPERPAPGAARRRRCRADVTRSPGARRRRWSTGSPDRTSVPADPAERTDAAAGDVAARPAPRLAPARGQGDVVGVPPPDGPDAGAARRRGRTRSACSNRSDRSTTTKKGKQTWRYRFPAQDFDLGRGEVYDPAHKQARPGRLPVQLGRRHGRRADPAARPSTSSGSVAEPHPRAIVPLTWVRTSDHRRASSNSGEWVADHGIDADGPHARGARPAPRPPAAGRPGGRRALLARRTSRRSTAARRLGARARPDDPRRSRVRRARARRTAAPG